MSIIQIALIFFLITNPIGNSPAVLALIKDHPLRKQQKILLRESIFSMLLAVFFLFLGDIFLTGLNIKDYALTISGGILLLIVSIQMIFSIRNDEIIQAPKQDPYIVPIATPLLSGAGLLTMIMLYSKKEGNDLKILLAILVAWTGVIAIMVTAPYLQVFLGKRGMLVLEQLMGMLLAMMAIGMLVNGTVLFLNSLV